MSRSLDLVAGADGCRSGWVRLTREPGSSEIALEVFPDAQGLLLAEPQPAVLALDVPIGLTEAGPRACDLAARKVLGQPRGSSVFPAPIRPALAARSHGEASEIRSRVDGRRVSIQAWAIYRRIREIDDLLRDQPELTAWVREVHPEVCFWAWNGERPLEHNKKKRLGREERSRLIDRHFGAGAARGLVDSRPPGVAADDVLDACAALWTAERVGRGEARTLPLDPPRDVHGLRMEMVY